jgi:hypothetical protein
LMWITAAAAGGVTSDAGFRKLEPRHSAAHHRHR